MKLKQLYNEGYKNNLPEQQKNVKTPAIQRFLLALFLICSKLLLSFITTPSLFKTVFPTNYYIILHIIMLPPTKLQNMKQTLCIFFQLTIILLIILKTMFKL